LEIEITPQMSKITKLLPQRIKLPPGRRFLPH